MTEKKFENLFHKRYVGGEGEVMEMPLVQTIQEYVGQTVEEIREAYRKYVGDPRAELPPIILAELARIGKIPA